MISNAGALCPSPHAWACLLSAPAAPSCLTPDSPGRRTRWFSGSESGAPSPWSASWLQLRAEEKHKPIERARWWRTQTQSPDLTRSSVPVRPGQAVPRGWSKWFCHWRPACGPEPRSREQMLGSGTGFSGRRLAAALQEHLPGSSLLLWRGLTSL